MPKFAANLTTMYGEHPFLDRFAAAAKDGFRGVEILFPYANEAAERWKEAYDAYSHRLVPKLGKLLAGDEESYRYLVESIRRFPTMDAFRAEIDAAGFVQTRVEPMLGGLVAIHSGWKI